MTTQETELLQTALSALRRRAKVNYERDLEAIERVERLIAAGAEITAESAQHLLATATAAPVIMNGEIVPDDSESQPTLIDAVERAFKTFPSVSLNVSSLETHLRKTGFVLAAKQPKSSINTAVSRLAERGIIRIVRRGTGRKASTYRLVLPEVHQNNGAVSAES
jgi:hypothetical protein